MKEQLSIYIQGFKGDELFPHEIKKKKKIILVPNGFHTFFFFLV